jgi:radical SAM superfamily enzyme YgiQ (UPF0313 family)
MKIALISPKSNFLGHNKELQDFWNKSGYIETYRKEWSGCTVALSLIAELTPTGYSIDIYDENVEPIDFRDDYNLVGITCMTQQATRAYQISRKFREMGIPVVMGGIHPSTLPQETIQHADSVVIGEVEYIWEQLLNDLNKHKLKKIYRSNTPVDLKDSPIPRYDLLKNKNYLLHWVQTTRGCPHDCIFCAASRIYGYRYRIKPVSQVIKEIKYIKEQYPLARISFADDNMFVNRNYSKRLLKELVPLNIRYMAQSDISVAEDDELLKMIKESGCTFLFIGFESLSDESMKEVDRKQWKAKYLKNYKKYINKIQSYGIGVMGAFILGFENDNELIFDHVIDFIKSNCLYNAQVSILTPFPGTEIRKRMISENRLLFTEWHNYTGCDVNFIHKNLSKKQLEKGLVHVYKSINDKDYFEKKMKYFKEIHKNLLLKNKI